METYKRPALELLENKTSNSKDNKLNIEKLKEKLIEKLKEFSINVASIEATPGPVITLFEIVPAPGVKIRQIENLSNDLALALRTDGIRIIAPLPKRGTIGIEIPNQERESVTLYSMLASSEFQISNYELPIALGKTIDGKNYIEDITRMPHLLIAGTTGSGKSIGLHTILNSLLFKLLPSDVKFAIIDPKRIEFSIYNKLKKSFLATCPDIDEDIVTKPTNAIKLLKSLELEMENRYDRLASLGVRNIIDYNTRIKEGTFHNTETIYHEKMPYIVLIVDELADLMITSANEVEPSIIRLAQLARAVGIHLIFATQRPSVDVITGVIKANFPARLSYQVASKVDSKTILDMPGAEQLIGKGDMLYLPVEYNQPIRLQNPFVSTNEIERVVEAISNQNIDYQEYHLPSIPISISLKAKNKTKQDDLFERAAYLAVQNEQISLLFLQRQLKIKYFQAAQLLERLKNAGIIKTLPNGLHKALITTEIELQTKLKQLEE